MIEKVKRVFSEKFNQTPLLFRSPGRVNIIGEHTDYNDGFVLPAAIDKMIVVAISKRDDGMIALHACDFNEDYTCRVDEVRRSPVQWANYILGVVDQLQIAGHRTGGFNLVVDGDVPIGSGLSSSAAVECASIYALNELFGLGISKIKMIHMAQKAEHNFAGVMCGIMDQFASMLGKKDHVIKLDCRSLAYEYIPFNLGDYKIVLLNSNVKHNLASSEYNTRRAQCEEGVAIIKKADPSINSLRDVNMELLNTHLDKSGVVFKRCKYVVEENLRLLAACEHLKNGDITALGRKMYETHEGLSREYEVSCLELDFLVDFVKPNSAVAGARMMGGGFGGCTINLVREDAIEKLVENATAAYRKAMNLELSVYIASIGDGTSAI